MSHMSICIHIEAYLHILTCLYIPLGGGRMHMLYVSTHLYMLYVKTCAQVVCQRMHMLCVNTHLYMLYVKTCAQVVCLNPPVYVHTSIHIQFGGVGLQHMYCMVVGGVGTYALWCRHICIVV